MMGTPRCDLCGTCGPTTEVIVIARRGKPVRKTVLLCWRCMGPQAALWLGHELVEVVEDDGGAT